jgi:site-specific recombinase XerD
MTIQDAIDRYLKQIKRAKSQHTVEAYGRALALFGECMAGDGLEFSQMDVSALSPLWLEPFLNHLRRQSVSTEHLYTTAVAGFYRYVAAQDWAALNLATLDFELSQRRNQGQRLHLFPENNLEKLLAYMENLAAHQPVDLPAAKNTADILTVHRDVALLITLADTGLRVSEACGLRRGDLDLDSQRAVIIGKGDKQAIVRFSARAVDYLRRYLKARAELDRQQGRQNILPLFARHDKRAGQRVLPISARTAENIVADYVLKALGEEARGSITPHTFRHYFVTRAARQHNILLAQHLARHESINTTSGYTHLTDTEIDQAYTAVFDPIPVEENSFSWEDEHES